MIDVSLGLIYALYVVGIVVCGSACLLLVARVFLLLVVCGLIG